MVAAGEYNAVNAYQKSTRKSAFNELPESDDPRGIRVTEEQEMVGELSNTLVEVNLLLKVET